MSVNDDEVPNRLSELAGDSCSQINNIGIEIDSDLGIKTGCIPSYKVRNCNLPSDSITEQFRKRYPK